MLPSYTSLHSTLYCLLVHLLGEVAEAAEASLGAQAEDFQAAGDLMRPAPGQNSRQTQTTQALGQHGQLRCLQPFLGEWRLQRCWLPCTHVHKAADGLESRLEPRVASCDRRGEGCPRRSSAFQESRRDAADPDESSQSETCPGRLRRGRSCGEPELGPWPQSSSQTGPVQGSIPRMVRQRILEGAR